MQIRLSCWRMEKLSKRVTILLFVSVKGNISSLLKTNYNYLDMLNNLTDENVTPQFASIVLGAPRRWIFLGNPVLIIVLLIFSLP